MWVTGGPAGMRVRWTCWSVSPSPPHAHVQQPPSSVGPELTTIQGSQIGRGTAQAVMQVTMLFLPTCGLHQFPMEEHFASQPCYTASFRGKDWEINLQTIKGDSAIPTSSQEG